MELGLAPEKADQRHDGRALDRPGLGQRVALERGQPSIAGVFEGDGGQFGLRDWRRGGGGGAVDGVQQRVCALALHLLEKPQVFLVVDLPALGDRAIGGAGPVKDQFLQVVGLGQAGDQFIGLALAQLVHALVPQHIEGLSIARS
ncbi:hypothetical protein D3C75_1000150 [compost metagenome]